MSYPLKSKRASTSSLMLTGSIKWDLALMLIGSSNFNSILSPLVVLLLSFWKGKSPPKGFMHQDVVTTSARIKEDQNSRLRFLDQFWAECNPSLSAF